MSQSPTQYKGPPQEPNLLTLFFQRSAIGGDQAFIWERLSDGWRYHSWQVISDKVLTCAAALRQRGISRGMRVAIIAENRHEWVVADLAIMLLGAISVPLFTTQTSTDYGFLLRQSGARAAICSSARLAYQVEPAAQAAPNCLFMVVMDPGKIFRSFANLAILSWDDLMTEGTKAKPVSQDEAEAIRHEDIACIIYNSGATESPKGVMLTHKSILANLIGIEERFSGLKLDKERFLSFLPLSHAYEHTVGLFHPIHMVSEIFFLPRPELLSTAMLEVKPTLMTAVPRLYDVLKDRLETVFRQQGPLARFLFNRTVTKRDETVRWRFSDLFHYLEKIMLDIMIRRPVKARLGGNLKAFISGGAALNPEVGYFFNALNVQLLQGYGLTEASPVVSVNPPEKLKLATVGLPLKGAQVKVTSAGELCVKGDMIMAGYWDDPAATRQAIKKGWLHTGDLAEIDEDGYITILGVKRDMLVNSGGENISPLRVEMALTALPDIEQAMIVGDRRPFVAAILTPATALLTQARDKEASEDIAADNWLIKRMADAVQTANANLSPSERIRQFILSDEPFSAQNKLLTASGQLRRKIIQDHYAARIDAMYHKQKQ